MVFSRMLPGDVHGPRQVVDDIHPSQQEVYLLGTQVDLAFLSRNEAILHHVGHPDRSIHAHNSRAPLDGMGSTHQSLQLFGCDGIVLEGKETVI